MKVRIETAIIDSKQRTHVVHITECENESHAVNHALRSLEDTLNDLKGETPWPKEFPPILADTADSIEFP